MNKFRKRGPRTFYSIGEARVVRVINQYNDSEIKSADKSNRIALDDALDETIDITESEFNEQYQLAMERITNQKADV